MALTSLKGGLPFPNPIAIPILGNLSGTSILTGQQLNAASQKLAYIFQAPVTENLTDVCFIATAVGGSGDCDVRLETVDASTGAPTGTLVAANTDVTKTISGTGKQVATLTSAASLTKGTFYAVVLARSTGDYTLAYWASQGMGSAPNPYASYGTYLRYHNGTSWQSRTASPAKHGPIYAVKFATSGWVHIPGNTAISALTRSTFNNTSATRERGVAIIPRVPMTVEGFYLFGQMMNGNCDVVLATTDGTARLTHTGDKDYGSNYVAGGSNYGLFTSGMFGSTYDLVAGTTYYLTMKPSSATDVNLWEVNIIDTADTTSIGALPMGADFKLVTRNSSGTYTVSDTARPLSMGLIVSHLGNDVGGSSGGGLKLASRGGLAG